MNMIIIRLDVIEIMYKFWDRSENTTKIKLEKKYIWKIEDIMSI